MNSAKHLSRTLGLFYVIGVVIANILGSGVYKKVAPMAAELNSSAWVLIAWITAGAITLIGALCNAEVAGLLADTGGEFVYYKKIYNRFFAFIFGWSLFAVIQTAAIASIAYVFAQSLDSILHLPTLFPAMTEFNLAGIFYPFAGFSIKLTAILLIIGLSWINTRGIKTGAGLSNGILLLVVAGIALIIIFGLNSNTASFSQSFDFSESNSTVTTSTFITAMLAAFWAYQGWYSIGFIGGEIKDAKKNLPKGVALGVIFVIAIYLLINATYLSLLSIPELNRIYSAGNEIAAVEAVRSFWGNSGALFISVLILITTLGCTHASILTGARPYYAMAKEGLFFAPVAKLNDKQTPVNSLLFQCVWACILVLSGSFDQLTDMVIFAVFVFYGATAVGVFILRYKMPDANRPYKVWGYPVLPAIFILFCSVLFINTVITRPREAGIGIVLMLTGIPMYWYFNRSKK